MVGGSLTGVEVIPEACSLDQVRSHWGKAFWLIGLWGRCLCKHAFRRHQAGKQGAERTSQR